ncbi:hypothetical protein ES708_08154 [subsurface metagenome]
MLSTVRDRRGSVSVNAANIKATGVEMTIVGGRIVYQKERNMAFYKHGEMKAQAFGRRRKRVVVHTDNLMMVIFDFDDGPADKPDPLHSHPHYIVSGKVIYFLGEEQQILEAGDMVTIPPDVPHAIQALTPSVRLADAFTPVREDFLS